MKQSPIQLLQLTFKRVRVELDAQNSPDEVANAKGPVFAFDGVGIATEVGFGEIDVPHEHGSTYLVTLRVAVDNEASPEEPPPRLSPYLVDIEAAGIILLPKGGEQFGPPADLVTVNGAALLWSAIREQVLTLTSRMPAGPAMLPTVHFHDLKQGVGEAPPTGGIAAAAKKSRSVARKSTRSKAEP